LVDSPPERTYLNADGSIRESVTNTDLPPKWELWSNGRFYISSSTIKLEKELVTLIQDLIN
jgi:hypothetical protein